MRLQEEYKKNLELYNKFCCYLEQELINKASRTMASDTDYRRLSEFGSRAAGKDF